MHGSVRRNQSPGEAAVGRFEFGVAGAVPAGVGVTARIEERDVVGVRESRPVRVPGDDEVRAAFPTEERQARLAAPFGVRHRDGDATVGEGECPGQPVSDRWIVGVPVHGVHARRLSSERVECVLGGEIASVRDRFGRTDRFEGAAVEPMVGSLMRVRDDDEHDLSSGPQRFQSFEPPGIANVVRRPPPSTASDCDAHRRQPSPTASTISGDLVLVCDRVSWPALGQEGAERSCGGVGEPWERTLGAAPEHRGMSQEPDGAPDDGAGSTASDSEPDRPAVVERDAVASTFADAAPRTLAEIVEETGLERDAAERVLAELVDDGDLARKTIQTGATTVTVWYQPASRHVERLASTSPAPPRADAVADAVESMDVPGVSEMMQDWRRDAILGAWEFVADQGAATDEAIVDAVYGAHSAGYEDRENWWDCVRPRLADLPGIEPPGDGDGDVWTYTPA